MFVGSMWHHVVETSSYGYGDWHCQTCEEVRGRVGEPHALRQYEGAF